VAYVLVLLLAAAAGAAVGIATLRTGGVRLAHPETWSATYAQERPAAAEAAVATGPESASAAGRRPLPTDPTWQTRVTGVLGLLVACLVGAGLVVAALYATFLAVKRAFGG
jgi:hypothetical protein